MKTHSQSLLKPPLFHFISGITVAAAVLFYSAPIGTTGETVAPGAGSHSTGLPEGCKPPPNKIHKTADVKAPIDHLSDIDNPDSVSLLAPSEVREWSLRIKLSTKRS